MRARTAWTAALCLALATPGAAWSGPAPGDENALVSLVRAVRADAGLSWLRVDPGVRVAARRHSGWMVRTGRFEHERALSFAGRGGGGQNLAAAGTPVEAVRAMLDSPPHRRNLLDPRWRRIGVGAVRGPGGMLLVTVNLTGR